MSQKGVTVEPKYKTCDRETLFGRPYLRLIRSPKKKGRLNYNIIIEEHIYITYFMWTLVERNNKIKCYCL